MLGAVRHVAPALACRTEQGDALPTPVPWVPVTQEEVGEVRSKRELPFPRDSASSVFKGRLRPRCPVQLKSTSTWGPWMQVGTSPILERMTEARRG